MVRQSWMFCLLGTASLSSVAFAQASQRPSSFSGPPPEWSPERWCSSGMDHADFASLDDIAALEDITNGFQHLEPRVDMKTPIQIPVNVFLIGTEQQLKKIAKVPRHSTHHLPKCLASRLGV